MTIEDQKGDSKASVAVERERAVILEFENVVLNSRAAMYAIMKQSLAAYDKELSIPLFSRYCIYDRPANSIPKLAETLDIATRSVDKVIKEVQDGMDAYWKSADKECRPGVGAFLADMHARGFALIALTALSAKQAAQAIQGLGEVAEGIEIHSYAEQGKLVAGADIWLQAAIDRDINPGLCIGLASSSKSCWAAMSADLHCIAVMDEFTAYQDFGGASLCYDSLEAADVAELIETFYQDSDS